MDAFEKEKVKIKLIEEINSTSKKINKYKELSKPVAPENSIGRISRMDAINNKSVIEAALRESQFKLNQLKKINPVNFYYNDLSPEEYEKMLELSSQYNQSFD